MNQQAETVIASLKIEFAEADIECLFTKVYDYFFAPRNQKTRVAAGAAVAEAVRAYEAEKQLPPWLIPALTSKQRDTLSVDDESGQNVAQSIEKVLDSNDSFVTALAGDKYTTWAHGIPLLWTLVFVEVYGEFPKNKPGTAPHYADGATDDRFEDLLNKKNIAGDETGYRYMLAALGHRRVQS